MQKPDTHLTGVVYSLSRVRRYVSECGIPPGPLAEKAGLGVNTLRGVDHINWNPTVKTLEAVEQLIPEEFY